MISARKLLYIRTGMTPEDTRFNQIVDAMEELANLKLDQAKHDVSLRETKIYTTPDTDTGLSQGIEAAIESIDLLKYLKDEQA